MTSNQSINQSRNFPTIKTNQTAEKVKVKGQRSTSRSRTPKSIHLRGKASGVYYINSHFIISIAYCVLRTAYIKVTRVSCQNTKPYYIIFDHPVFLLIRRQIDLYSRINKSAFFQSKIEADKGHPRISSIEYVTLPGIHPNLISL